MKWRIKGFALWGDEVMGGEFQPFDMTIDAKNRHEAQEMLATKLADLHDQPLMNFIESSVSVINSVAEMSTINRYILYARDMRLVAARAHSGWAVEIYRWKDDTGFGADFMHIVTVPFNPPENASPSWMLNFLNLFKQGEEYDVH